MAKISYNKFEKPTYPEDKVVEFQGQQIEVRQWVPTAEKLQAIGSIIELAHDPSINYANPTGLDVFTSIYIIKLYSNIEFTDELIDSGTILYDEINNSGLLELVKSAIPQQELQDFLNKLKKTYKAYYQYRQSALGLVEIISTDYSDIDQQLDNIQTKFENKDNLTYVKDLLEKLG